MNVRFYFLLILLCIPFYSFSEKKTYPLTDEPIDVVIVSHPKDKETIDDCIAGIKNNGKNIRRVIVVSPEKLTNNAEWFDERNFPFSKQDVLIAIGKSSKKRANLFFDRHYRPVGWYLQQLLKLYSPFVIPDISSNVLVIDADTIFMNPVEFLNEENGGLFCTSNMHAKNRYLKHAKLLVPNYKRVYPEVYSVCHHMLFQRSIMKDLFMAVETHHKKKFWVAFCNVVMDANGASEYEIYYNFALNHTNQVALRELKWRNSPLLELKDIYQKEGYQFVSFHTYMREEEEAKKKALKEEFIFNH